MTPAAAQLQFGAEFLGFLAAIAGVALSLLRAAPRRPPPAAAVAFAGLAAVAFLAGSRLEDRNDPLVAFPRLIAAALLAVAVVLWKVESRTKVLLLASAVATALAVLLAGLKVPTGADAAVATAGLCIGAAVLDLARRSVASRIAVSGGLSLLVIVLVLSVTLSVVVERNLRNEAVKRLNDRAAAEVNTVTGTLINLTRAAVLAQTVLTQSVNSVPGRLAAVIAPTSGRPNVVMTSALEQLYGRSFEPARGYLFVDPRGSIVGQAGPQGLIPEQADLVRLAGSRVIAATGCQQAIQADVVVLGNRAYATVALATCQDGQDLGRFVALLQLDKKLLAPAQARDEGSSLALIGENGPVARGDGDQPDEAAERGLAQAVLRDGVPRSDTVGGRFISVALVKEGRENGRSLNLALVASSSTTTFSDTRDGLFKALFVIALLGTLVAFLLAAVVGERIGARLRSLTQAAAALGRGDPGVRTGLAGDDEVGTLGATFDVMAAASEDKTETEGRLRGRLEAVVGGMGEALVATDGEARITDFNRSAEELIGVSAGTARGRQVDEVVSLAADDGADLASRLKQPPRSQWSTSATLTPLDGPAVPVAVSGAPLRDPDGGAVGGVFVLRDLRGEREVERMKTEFLSRIGHELRTPLTGVLGYSEMLLRRDWPPERSRQMLEEVNSSGHRLERIVQLLEFFAAAAAGRTLLRLEPVDLRSVVDEVVKVWEPRVQPPLVLSRKVARDLPQVLGDARWLRLALSEMVDNAIKFSPIGGRVVISSVRTDDGRVDLAVTDHGVGMTATEVDRAFTDFEQGDTSDTRRYGGLGLGLPLVLRVAEGHGGEVRCATTPGRGTRLSMVLPPR